MQIFGQKCSIKTIVRLQIGFAFDFQLNLQIYTQKQQQFQMNSKLIIISLKTTKNLRRKKTL